MNAAERFFFRRAGYGYPAADAGNTSAIRRHRVRTAAVLAAAEALLDVAIAQGSVMFGREYDLDSALEAGDDRWGLLICAREDDSGLRGRCLASLWGIDDPNPHGYGRVVRAELALECVRDLAELCGGAS